MKNLLVKCVLIISMLGLSGCGYNTFQKLDEAAIASWAEVLNQYQRRADLIPNLVEVVKGYAAHEKEVFTDITNARSKASGIQMTPELLNDPAAMAKFQAAQGEVSSALSRLMLVVENYPDLKADQRFADLQAALEGAENRVSVARKRHIETVKEYNTAIRQFPNNLTAMMFDYDAKPTFTVENEKAISEAPKVEF